MIMKNNDTTDFGFEQVPEGQKAAKVAEVFHSVASRYDIMNDLMSGGLHRLWKANTVREAAARTGMRVLDIAGGTGDLSKAFLRNVGKTGEVWLTDINESMLRVGRDRLIDTGLMPKLALCDAEKLPFPDDYFDVVTVAFGLRNMTHKDIALSEMRRVIKPGGKVMVLEFSKVNSLLAPVYDMYSFKVLPKIGQLVAQDSKSYQYLAESIRMHPDQETLKQMMLDVGFNKVKYSNYTAGVVALHQGTKFE
jgi:demethylmenaquinone methyltransferase / 2-methoxy-6-polyprenyl-1,4-benzoquinol methylase